MHQPAGRGPRPAQRRRGRRRPRSGGTPRRATAPGRPRPPSGRAGRSPGGGPVVIVEPGRARLGGRRQGRFPGVTAYNAPRNYKDALGYFRTAANQGDAGAQIYLGVMFDLGQGVTQDYEAAMYLVQARRRPRGTRAAQFDIGILYENGRGVNAGLRQGHGLVRASPRTRGRTPTANTKSATPCTRNGFGVAKDNNSEALVYPVTCGEGPPTEEAIPTANSRSDSSTTAVRPSSRTTPRRWSGIRRPLRRGITAPRFNIGRSL